MLYNEPAISIHCGGAAEALVVMFIFVCSVHLSCFDCDRSAIRHSPHRHIITGVFWYHPRFSSRARSNISACGTKDSIERLYKSEREIALFR